MTDEVKPPTKDDLQIELWNRLLPQSEQMLSWFRRDEWEKILKPFLTDMCEVDLKLLLAGNTEVAADKFRMGRLSMLREIISLPATLARVSNRKTAEVHPKGDAGY